MAKTLQISWTANTEKDLSGYRIYYGTSSGNYTYCLNVGNTTSVNVAGFLDGTTYYVAVTAYDFSGNESAFSSEVTVSIPAATSGGGVLSTIMGWISSLFGSGSTASTQLADYDIQDFSSLTSQKVAQALSVVRAGGADSSTATSIEPVGSAEYVIKDAITLVGEYYDLSNLYPDGTYFFLPLTANTPGIESNVFTATAPGAYLYFVADDSGEYLHLLRISTLGMMYAYSDYTGGSPLYLQDAGSGVSVTLTSAALEGSVPIAIGQNNVDVSEANAQTMAGHDTLEFSIAPYGLTLQAPAEVRVPYSGSAAVVEYYDQNEDAWKAIDGVSVEGGEVVFSAQQLGRFRVYDPTSSGGGSSGGSGGGGCFISTCM